jgi:superfamily I DNA/RNA helicase
VTLATIHQSKGLEWPPYLSLSVDLLMSSPLSLSTLSLADLCPTDFLSVFVLQCNEGTMPSYQATKQVTAAQAAAQANPAMPQDNVNRAVEEERRLLYGTHVRVSL